jgi:hypothetical protein
VLDVDLTKKLNRVKLRSVVRTGVRKVRRPIARVEARSAPRWERWQYQQDRSGRCCSVHWPAPERAGGRTGRPHISARKATPRERRSYEQGLLSLSRVAASFSRWRFARCRHRYRMHHPPIGRGSTRSVYRPVKKQLTLRLDARCHRMVQHLRIEAIRRASTRTARVRAKGHPRAKVAAGLTWESCTVARLGPRAVTRAQLQAAARFADSGPRT